MLSTVAGLMVWDTWMAWNTWRKALRCSEDVWMRSQMEMFALTFLSWEVMSALGWPFLVVEGVALVVGSTMVGTGGWPDGRGVAG